VTQPTTSIGKTITQASLSAKQPTTKDLHSHLDINPSVGLNELQIVAISDTHCFEGQLLTESSNNFAVRELVPHGDVLFHLGNLALEGSLDAERKALEAFDKWLAQQLHPV
jgi:hypothetical protein